MAGEGRQGMGAGEGASALSTEYSLHPLSLRRAPLSFFRGKGVCQCGQRAGVTIPGAAGGPLARGDLIEQDRKKRRRLEILVSLS